MEIADHFAIRYYEWSLERSKEEVSAGFPLLSLLRGRHAFKFLAVAQRLQLDLRDKFAAAMVKRFHPRAGALGAFTITGEEHELIDMSAT